jgi:ribosomal protein S18 acetylase RimI-like enzyme
VIEVRQLQPAHDGAWLEAFLEEQWGGPLQARRGELVDARHLPALVARRDGERVGLLCYRDDGGRVWELALLSAADGHTGIGSALLAALVDMVGAGARIWVVTTNDNVDAMRFYQRRGFRLRELRPGAVDESRRVLKPKIPVTGRYGIPLRDEVELVLDV